MSSQRIGMISNFRIGKYSKKILLFIAILAIRSAWAQSNDKGVVTYISAENVYVRFENTKNLNIGDTLFKTSNQKPLLVLQKKSSTSTINSRISDETIILGDSFYGVSKVVNTKLQADSQINLSSANHRIQKIRFIDTLKTTTVAPKAIANKWNWHGYTSVSTRYNQTFNSESNRAYTQQFGRFNVKGVKKDSFRNSGLHLSGNYQHFYSQFQTTEAPKWGRIYLNQAEFSTNLSSHLDLKIGRGFQNGLSSIGALDALKLGLNIHQIRIEGVCGFSPEYRTHLFSTQMPVLGLSAKYQNHELPIKWDVNMGWMNQYKGADLDRNLLLFQSSAFNQNTYAFFLLENDITQGFKNARVQSTYLSIQHKFNTKWNAFISYDTRTPWIFWQTYDQLTIDDLIEREAQRGFRFRVNYKQNRYLNWGIQSTLRTSNFRKEMMLLGLNVAHNHFIWKGSTLSYRLNLTDYLTWQNAQQIVRWSDYYKESTISIYYRSNIYSRNSKISSIFNQSSVGAQWSFPIAKQYDLDAFIEQNIQQQQQHLFCYLTLSKRF